ncbi:MAG: hypothetical protein ACOYVD_02190 [Bacillota bacterium]
MSKSKIIPKEGIKKVLQELETAGALEKLKGNNIKSSASRNGKPKIDLTLVREFVQTIEQIAASETRELTKDEFLKAMEAIKESLFSQLDNQKK